MATTIKNLPKEVRIHPTCNIFPMLSGEAYLMLEQSVREVGILDPITLWKADDRLWYVIDGKNRWAVWNSLKQQEALPEVNKELPFNTVEGNEVEIIERIMAKGMARRHLTSSQRAACLIKSEMLREQAQESLGQQEPESSPRLTGLSSEYLAKCSGTNRQYIFDARYIAENDMDVLERVVSGELKINDAKAVIRSKLAGEVEPADGTPPEADSVTPPAADVILDGEGNPVTDPNLIPIFQARTRFGHAASLSNQIRAAIMDCLDSAGGTILRVMEQEVLSQVSALRKTIKQNQPHVACPSCHGSGHETTDSGNVSRKVCAVCSGHKYLNVIQSRVWAGVPFTDLDEQEQPETRTVATPAASAIPEAQPEVTPEAQPEVNGAAPKKARRKAARKARKAAESNGEANGQAEHPEATGELVEAASGTPENSQEGTQDSNQE